MDLFPQHPAAMSSDCPSRDVLQSFVLGTLAETVAEGIAWHLDGCPSCQSVLPQLPHVDALLASLRRHLRTAEREPNQDSAPATVRAFLTDAPPAALPALGSVVGSYRLLERIGSGGMGVVFKALDVQLDRMVAVKFVRGGWLADNESLRRFDTDARALARLKHPHILPIYDYDKADGAAYFVLEWMPVCLAHKLGGQSLLEREAAQLVEVLARAVQFAHEQQVLHRDLKPANVLLAADGSAKLTDFGLAKLLDADAGHTESDAVMGTPSYMAPEQALGDMKHVGVATDVYGLGAILYEALTGQPPFRGANKAETLELVCSREPTLPSRLRKRLSRALEAICLKCLEKDPRRRYHTALELADDLNNWLHQRPTKAQPASLLRKLAWFLARRKRLVAAALLAVAVLGASWFASWKLDPERPRREAQAALQHNKPYSIKGTEPLPGCFRWVSGDPGNLTVNQQDECLTFHTLDTSLLEVVDKIPCDRYRFSVQLRHDDTAGGSYVGVYLLFHENRNAEGLANRTFATFTFGDHENSATVGKNDAGEYYALAVLTCRGLTDDFNNMSGKSIGNAIRFTPALPPNGGPALWRNLDVIVSPKGFTGQWTNVDGAVAKTFVSAEKYEKTVKDVKRANIELKDIPEGFHQHGGLGLIGYRGQISVRNIVIQPLLDE